MNSASAPYHHGNLRIALLSAAERALAGGGGDALSLRALARELGVSHAAPAKHFPDRRALLDALAIEGFTRMAAGFEHVIVAQTSSREQIQALATSYLAFAAANPALLALMFEHKMDPEASPEVLVAGHGAMELTVAIVAQGQATGEIIAGDPERIATIAFATVHGIATLGARGLLKDVPNSEIAADAMTALWQGIAVHP